MHPKYGAVEVAMLLVGVVCVLSAAGGSDAREKVVETALAAARKLEARMPYR